MRVRAVTFFPGDSAPGESRVAVVLRDRTYHHDPDTIALLTFPSATTDLLCASRESASEHSHADQYTNAYHPTHRHHDLRSSGLQSVRRKEGAGDSSRVSFLCEKRRALWRTTPQESREAAANDVNMPVCTGGRQRSAGFRLPRIVPTMAMSCVIEGVKA
jgi:hypothetical protein